MSITFSQDMSVSLRPTPHPRLLARPVPLCHGHGMTDQDVRSPEGSTCGTCGNPTGTAGACEAGCLPAAAAAPATEGSDR